MSTEKKWADHWAEFCAQYAIRCVDVSAPYDTPVSKSQGVQWLNQAIEHAEEDINPHLIQVLRRMQVRSKSVTWRALAQRMRALNELCNTRI